MDVLLARGADINSSTNDVETAYCVLLLVNTGAIIDDDIDSNKPYPFDNFTDCDH